MDDVEWPLVTVEFDSLRGHPMDGIYEVHILIISNIYNLTRSLQFIDTPVCGVDLTRPGY
jgi:hypothetical protein